MDILVMILPTITFIVGFYFGFNCKSDKIPEINPIKVVEKKKEEKVQEKRKAVQDQYLENINNYPNNQKVLLFSIFQDFLINALLPFVLCFIIAYFKHLSIQKKNKKLFIVVGFLDYLL